MFDDICIRTLAAALLILRHFLSLEVFIYRLIWIYLRHVIVTERHSEIICFELWRAPLWNLHHFSCIQYSSFNCISSLIFSVCSNGWFWTGWFDWTDLRFNRGLETWFISPNGLASGFWNALSRALFYRSIWSFQIIAISLQGGWLTSDGLPRSTGLNRGTVLSVKAVLVLKLTCRSSERLN